MIELFHSTIAYRTIERERKEGTLSHATLVVFPDEVYLRAFLKECAKAFFGAEEGDRTARLIDGETFSDCKFYPAQDGKWTVEDGKAIVSESALRPVEGENKLFVLDRFHAASPVVQNKLLKILEEPPAGVYFLLGATGVYGILPTVLSRSKKIVVEPFSDGEIARTLSEMCPFQGNTAQAAAAAGGILSSAEKIFAGGGEEFRLALRFLGGSDTGKFCREYGERRGKRELLAAIRLALKDILFYKTGQKTVLGGEELIPVAEGFSVGAAIASLEALTEIEKDIQFNANFVQALEALAIVVAEEKIKWQKLS